MLHERTGAASTERGLVRKNNQDSYFTSPENGLVIVADGMGVHNGGEIASDIAVRGISDALLQQDWQNTSDEMEILLKLGESVEKANLLIRQKAASNVELTGMGTTVAVALFISGRVFLAHVGDSRIYRFRNNRLERMTKDHSLVQQLVDTGVFVDVAEAEAAGIGSNFLTRGLGIEDQVEVDVTDEPIQSGDQYLFCSDGLTGMVDDDSLERLVKQ